MLNSALPGVRRAGSRQRRVSLAALNWNLSLRAVFDAVCGVSGFIFVNYALSLGVAKEKMGYFTSLVSIACLFQMLALMLSPYILNKKRYALTLGFVEPVIMIAAVLTAPLVPPGWRLPFVTLAVFMAAALLHLTKPTTDDWISASIPDGIRGRYLGRRMQLQSFALIATTIVSGFMAERVDRSASWDWALLMTVGGLFGVLAIRAMARASMPDVSSAARVCWRDFGAVVRDRPFRLCVAGYLCISLPFFVACPYYQVFYLRVLQLNESVIAALIAGYYIMRIVCLPMLGRLTDRVGVRPVLWLTLPIYVVFFAGLALLNPACRWPLALLWTLAGIADSALGVANLSAIYRCVPAIRVRQAYFAFLNVLLLVFNAVGALLGVPFLEALKHFSFSVGSVEFGHFNLLFGLCGALMIPCVFAARLYPAGRGQDTGVAPVRRAVGPGANNNPACPGR